jgi:hypothetical protein
VPVVPAVDPGEPPACCSVPPPCEPVDCPLAPLGPEDGPCWPGCPPEVPACPPDVPALPEGDELGLPWEPPVDPDGGAPPGLVEDDELLLGGDEDGGVLLDPDEPELPLGGELGTGMPLELGWVMTVCDRQPDSSSALQAVIAAHRVRLKPVMVSSLPRPVRECARCRPAGPPTVEL